MKRVNFKTTTILFFLFLLSFNIVRFFICPCETGVLGFFFHHPSWFYFPVVIIYLVVPVALSFIPCSQFHHYPVVCRGIGTEKTVSLTFDDGPDPENTPAILEVLRKHNVVGTFFLIGHKIEGNEDLVKIINKEGHTLGNHSFSHTNFWDFWPPFLIHRDLMRAGEMINQVVGKKPKFFRPPFGVINPMVSSALRKCGYSVIAWSRWSLDTAIKNPENLFKRITKGLSSGDIILMHDTQKVTTAILEKVIIEIHHQGFRIVPLEKLINLPAYD